MEWFASMFHLTERRHGHCFPCLRPVLSCKHKKKAAKAAFCASAVTAPDHDAGAVSA